MSSSEFLCLRWNEFEANIKAVFSGLRRDEDFFDITLACGSRHLKAHKMILSAFSPSLRSIIKSVSAHERHPLLYLRGIQFRHLESLITFMYNGEVNVPQEDLDDFLAVAEELQIKGLVQGSKKKSSSSSSNSNLSNLSNPSPSESAKNIASVPLSSKFKDLSEDEPKALAKFSSSSSSLVDPMIVNLNPVDLADDKHFSHDDEESKCLEEDFAADYGSELQDMDASEDNSLLDPGDLLLQESSGSTNMPSNHKDLLDIRIMKLASTQRNDKGNLKCLKCSYETPRLMDLKRHIESKHFVTDGFPCETCGFRSKTRYGLYRHRTRNHRLDPEYFSTI